MHPRSRAIVIALSAAILFGVSTPAAKVLLAVSHPWMVAGLLYLGSGVGLGGYRLTQAVLGFAPSGPRLRRRDLPWLGGAIVIGGVAGPLLLMFGLAHVPASQAALLLNLEGVFTTALAWLVFREAIHRRIVVGMAAITAGGLALVWAPGAASGMPREALAIVAACLAWAIDNNLTREVSGGDAVLIASLKGGVAGVVNVGVALAAGAAWPSVGTVVGVAVIGLLGYGVSLVLFVYALRALGTVRTGAYFATAPFVGALASVAVLREPLTVNLVAAGALMAVGVWLHLTEWHDHAHTHEFLEHDHVHEHDLHHQHGHATGEPPGEPHSHPHVHAPLRHAHPHYPDLHHRHRH